MRQTVKQFFLTSIVVALLGPFACAGSKEDAARELLAKSFQQANIWTQGPLQLVAEVRIPRPKMPDLDLTYEVSWAGPDKWRAEWSGEGYSRIIVVNGGKLYRYSTDTPPLSLLEYESALGALTGRAGYGPGPDTPDVSKAKIEVTTEKVGKTAAKCLRTLGYSRPFCLDPASARGLTWESDIGRFEYSDYAAANAALFPQSIRLMRGKDLLQESRITVTPRSSFPDALFTAPAAAVATEYPSCSDEPKKFEAPKLEKHAPLGFPRWTLRADQQASVWLYAIVGKDGSINSLTPIGRGERELQRVAVDGVKQWKYSPLLRCGHAVEFETVIAVVFSIQGYN